MTDLFWPPAPVEEPAAPAQPEETASASRGRGWRLAAAAAGLSALVFGGIGVGVGAALDHGSSAAALPAPAVAKGSLSADPTSYAGVAARVLPSVVSISVTTASGGDTGSGVILRSDGYILTNNHVIAAALGGGRIAVTFNDGSTTTASIVGADAQDDLAVLKVPRKGLTAAALGSASALHVGDAVIALGSPLGLQGTVTAGIVSALNRPVDTSNSQPTDPFGGTTTGVTTVLDAIQTDAAINPGNSGGPLVNAAGQVVGINSAIASNGTDGNIGVGFAIPIDQARVIAGQLITTGKASHPLLGVALADATDVNGTPLARVQALTPSGAAAKAGLHVGDVIVAVGDQPTAGAEAVIAAVRTHQPGERVQVTVLRDGDRRTFSVTLGNASDSQG